MMLTAHAATGLANALVCFVVLLVLATVLDVLGARRFGRPSVSERRAMWLVILMTCVIVFVASGGLIGF